MSEKGKRVLETISKAIPGMSDQEVDRLLSFGEGVAFMVNQRQNRRQEPEGQTAGRETA